MPLDIQPEEKTRLVRDLRNFGFLGFVGACQLITFVGLLGQLRLPDSPNYRDVHTDLLNPWSTWCQPNASCFGTGYAHWGGPYSIFWYWTNALVTLNGQFPYTPVMFIVNLGIQARLRGLVALLWAWNCIFVLLGWPQNIVIIQLVFLGFYSKWGLILSPIFKLPVGSFQAWVWNIAFNSHTAVRDPGNWFSYLWLIVMWSIAFLYIRRSKNLEISRKVPAESDYADPENIEGQSEPEIERLESKDENQGKVAEV